jgi:catechol 2,3-dioxygenase-like lactoylglutathione lyase family enzyme
MLIGAHLVLYSADADATRGFLRDVVGLTAVDAGGGWLIFGLPPAELAVHPSDLPGGHELFLMCEDLDAAVAQIEAHDVRVSRPEQQPSWGALATIHAPGGVTVGLYQPRHRTALPPDGGTDGIP